MQTPMLRLLQQGQYDAWIEELRQAGPQKFSAGQYDPGKVHKALSELRDSIETVTQHEYDRFLKVAIPLFIQFVKDTSDNALVDSHENRIRTMILEIINRLPLSEPMRMHSKNLMKMVLTQLNCDNEDNGLILLRILNDLHKNFRQTFEPEVSPFLEYVIKLYSSLPQTVQKNFTPPQDAPAMPGVAQPPPSPTPLSSSMQLGASGNLPVQPPVPQGQQAQPGPLPGQEQRRPAALIPAVSSFKVLTECPIIVVMLFQAYPAIQRIASRFAMLTVSALNVPLPSNARSMRTMYSDFIAAQVKTVSFIAYLVRLSMDMMRPSGEHIARGILQLLNNCPAEAAATRKELLVATRHIASTDLRKMFVGHIDQLLDDQVLLGTGRTCWETLRPLAFTTLADLVHHLRTDLTISQMARAAHLFARNLHDTTLPMTIANMSARLLIGLSETVSRRAADVVKYQQQIHTISQSVQPGQPQPPMPQPPPQMFAPAMGRDLVFRILDAFVCKFNALRKRIPKIIEAEATDKSEGQQADAENASSSGDNVKESRTLIKTLLSALKPITVSLLTANPPKRLTADETRLFVRLLRDGLRCIALFTTPEEQAQQAAESDQPAAPTPAQQQQQTIPPEKKELLDQFSSVFTILDSQAFAELFATQLPFVYDRMLEHPSFITLPQNFMQSTSICRVFLEILMNFLMECKINNLADKKEGPLILRLFKVAFQATATQMDDAEAVIQPHLQGIVSQIIKMAGEIRDSSNYFILLRNVFRHLQSRGEIISKELLPLMTGLLEGLNRLQHSAHSQAMRDMFIELVLTLPVRMSSLLPFLRLVIKPLVLALDTSDSADPKVGWGLRMFEGAIDKLSPDFLEPLLHEVKPRLMRALWRHLRPPPYPFAPQVLRIFGKLAGRSRNFFNSPLNAQTTSFVEPGLTVQWRFDVVDESGAATSRFVDISLQEVLPMARRLMMMPPSNQSFSGVARQMNAFKFIRACVTLFLDPNIQPADAILIEGVGEGISITESDDGSSGITFPLRVELSDGGRPVAKTLDKLRAEREALRSLLSDVITALAIENVAAEAKTLLSQIAMHFATLFVTRRRWNPTTLLEIDPLVLLDAIVDVISLENREHAAGGAAAIQELISSADGLCGTSALAEASSLPVFHILLNQVASLCYKREWQHKAGGCLGITTLAEKLHPDWLRSKQCIMVRALLFILKDLQPTVAVGTIEDASAAISSIIKAANTGLNCDSEPVLAVAALLVSNLTSSHSTVRKNVQSALQNLADAVGCELHVLLEQNHGLLEKLIFGDGGVADPSVAANHLKKLPPKTQTGILEALTYCISLPNPQHHVFQFNDAIAEIIDANLALAEQEEVASRAKPIVAQRIAVVELIAATMSSTIFATSPTYEALRVRIVGIFLKLLTGRHKQIIAAARRGIEVLQQQFNLTKEMLHGTLRPILLNLADFRHLSEPLMEGICRLLALLPKSFSVTLGEKLLEHLSMWHTQPQKVVASKQWKPGEEIRIAAGIVETMHLLPPQAARFMDSLVTHVMAVEEKLPAFAHATRKPCPREISSPFRDGLAKYLSKYPTETLEHFYQRLANPDFGRLFRNTLRNENAAGLRDEIAQNPAGLIKAAFTPTLQPDPASTAKAQDIFSLAFEGLQIVRILQKFKPNLLVESPALLQCVLAMWRSPGRIDRLRSEESITVQMSKESLFLTKILLTHCKANPDTPDTLFDLINAFVDKSTVDFSFLETFLTVYIPQTYTTEQKRNLIAKSLEFFARQDQPPTAAGASSSHLQEQKVYCLKMILHPLLSHCIEQKDPVADLQTVSQILKSVVVANGDQTFLPSLNIELLRLATLLVKTRAQDVVDHRKELIRFAWNHLKSEDLTTKQSAYLLVCRFVEAYDTPSKIILQVYVALLRAYQPEARHLVKEALDVLTPALGKRLAPNEPIPTWIKWTRKIIIEEGHMTQQMVHILQLIVRQSALFYQFRGQFVPNMVSALTRLSVQTNPYENRKLAVNIVETIIGWEKKRMELANSPATPSTDTAAPMDGVVSTAPAPAQPLVPGTPTTPAAATGSPGPVAPAPEVAAPAATPPTPSTPGGTAPPATPAPPALPEFRPGPPSTDIIASFLIRVGSGILDNQRNPAEGPLLSLMALKLLHDALVVWPTVQIKVALFEKLLEKTGEQPNLVITGLNMLDVVLEHQLDGFVPPNAQALENALVPVISTDNAKITEAFCPILTRLLKAYPWQLPPQPVAEGQPPAVPPQPHVLSNLYNRIRDAIASGLPAEKPDGRWTGENCVLMLRCICDSCPEAITPFVGVLLKFVTKQVVRDSQQGSNAPAGPSAASAPAQDPAGQQKDAAQKKVLGMSTLFTAVQLVNANLALLGNDRRVLFGAVQQVIEKSHDEALLVELVRLSKSWILSKELMTPKDRNAFLLKLRRFEKVPNLRQLPLLHRDYVDVVVTLYTEAIGEGGNVEELPALPSMFLGGLFSRDSSCRSRFFELLHQKLSTNVVDRLKQLVTVSTWQSHPYLFWIQPAAELLMCLIVPDAPLVPSFGTARVPAAIFGRSGPGAPQLTQQSCNLLNLHFMNFLTPLSTLRARDLIDPLRDMMFHDAELSTHLFTSLFSSIWDNVLEKQQFDTVLGSALQLLSHESVTKQQKLQPNVVQVLLRALSQCKKMNKQQIPVQLLKFCGSTFNCWHTALKLLEDQLVDPTTPQEMVTPIYSSLSDMLKRLGEDDMHYGTLIALQSHSEESKAALILEQHGMWQRAQELYFQAMQNARLGLSPLTSGQPASDKDIELWESHWIECAKRLTQWDLLADYARINSQPELLAEASWKLGDWAQLKEVFTKHGLSTDSPKLKLFQSFLALGYEKHENKIADVDAMCKQAMNVLVTQWISLPKTPCAAFTPMLHAFHQIIELYESAKIVKELGNQPAHRLARLNEIKSQILRAWRERLPSENDDLLQWNDILVWRQHVFSMITSAFQFDSQTPSDSPQNTAAVVGYHEAAWAINKFAHVARKQGLVELCLNSLAKIYSLPNIDLTDAFAKLFEQVKCFFDIPSQYRTAVDVVNSTNLSYFPPPLIAQFFQLKGEFLTRLQSFEEANLAFSSAVLRYENLAKGWVGWGRFHDSRMKQQQLVGGDNNQPMLRSALYAMSCYLQAIKCSTDSKARKYIPRILWLLNSDQLVDPEVMQELMSAVTPGGAGTPADSMSGAAKEVVKSESTDKPEGDTMEGVTENGTAADDEASRGRKRDASDLALETPAAKRVKREEDNAAEPAKEQSATAAGAQPAQLPGAPARRETDGSLLKQHIRNWPIASVLAEHSRYIPSWIWAFWIPQLLSGLRRQEAHVFKSLLIKLIPQHSHALFTHLHAFIQRESVSRNVEAMQVDGDAAQPTHVQLAKDIMEMIQQRYPVAVGDMEQIATQIASLCEPRVEDSVVNSLQRMYNLVLDQPVGSDDLSAALHQDIVATMDSVVSKLENAKPSGFTRACGAEFKADFGKQIPTRATQLLTLLRHWIIRIRNFTEGRTSSRSFSLERASPFLTEFQNENYIEVPGQHQDDKEASVEQSVIIEKFESLREIPSFESGVPKRVLSIRGSNGKLYSFFLEHVEESSVPPAQQQMIWAREGRLSQLSRLINRILSKSVQTKKRNIQTTTQEHVYVGSNARLVSTLPDVTATSHIVEQWCLRNGLPFDLLIKQRKLAADANGLFADLAKQIPDDILLNFLYEKVVDNFDAVWALRKQITTQLSALSVVQYLLGSSRRISPSSMFLSPETGAVILMNNHHEFDSETGLLDATASSVPFRLSRNLQRLVGPIVHNGTFDASVTASINALARDKNLQHLQNQLRLFLRDDIVDWQLACQHAGDSLSLAEQNTGIISDRLRAVAATPESIATSPINSRTTQLINASVDPANLASMPLSWAAWI